MASGAMNRMTTTRDTRGRHGVGRANGDKAVKGLTTGFLNRRSMGLGTQGSYNQGMFPEVAQDSPLLHNLNPEQRSAVTLPAEHALILAGAGSGKTRVLTTRIAWLLQTGQASPGGILAVTFTNKAAKEMMTRLTAMLPVNVRGMWIGTFHGLCNRFLRAHCKLANLPQTFQILDTQDQLSAIKRLMKQFNIDDERFPPKQMQYFICWLQGRRPARRTWSRRATRKRARRSRSTSSTKSSASAKAWSILAN